MELAGKVAMVTGGASGLGRATAEALADAGADVVIGDLPSADGDAVVEQVAERTRARPRVPRVAFVAMDVTDEEDVASAVGVAAGFGGLHVVVNCAGIATPGRVIGRNGPLALEQFAKVVEVNLIGTFNVVRLAAEHMARGPAIDEERGVIVLTASVAAFDGQVGQAAYAASKGGVAAMTLPLARDLADRQIRVCTIAPGIFATPMMEGLPLVAQQSLAAQVLHPQRLGRPQEYAALALHVVANPMLNGEVIRLDGALRMAPR